MQCIASTNERGIFPGSGNPVSCFTITQSAIFYLLPGKTDPHIGIPAGFTGPDWLNYGAKNTPIKWPLAGFFEGLFPPVLWRSKRNSGVFSTGTVKGDFAGFSGTGRNPEKGKGARIERICP
jgi:hypothetical protein